MAAVSTAIIGAAVIGGAATVYGVSQQKKQAKDTKKQLRKQEKAAKDLAREQGELEKVQNNSGSVFTLGRSAGTAVLPTANSTGASSNRKGSVKSRVGGLL